MSAPSEKRVVVFCLLLVAVTLAFYNPIVRNQFTDFDDSVYILKNTQVQSGLNWNMVKWSFTTLRAGYWQPITWLSHALDCQLFRLNPVGHHYVNLLLHAVNAVLLFLLLQQATGFTWSSLWVAALFALHPINVESVAWAAERKNVLSMLFFLVALYVYDRYARTGRRYLFWAVAVLFAVGLMAKSQIVTLPFVLLLWDYWPLRRMGAASEPDIAFADQRLSVGYLIWEKWPLFVLAAAGSVITVMAQRAGAAVRTAQEVSVSARFENVVVSYVRYLVKMFWPSRLAPMYPHPGNSLAAWQVAGGAAVLVLISALVWLLRDRRYLLVGWLWFLGTLVPMIGIITVGEQAMADRFAYIPCIGLFIATVWTIAAIAAEYEIRPVWLGSAVAGALIVLGSLTYHQLGYWHDDETLWRYTLSVTERNYMAHDNLALALAKQGRSDEAVVEFRAAEALHRYPPNQVLALAGYEMRVGHFAEAIDDCDSVLQASKDSQLQATAWSERGQAELASGRYDEASDSFRNALQLSAEDLTALIGSGVLAMRTGNVDSAVSQFDHAAKINTSPVNLLLLANALQKAGHMTEADSAMRQAEKVSPDLTSAQMAAKQILALADVRQEQGIERKKPKSVSVLSSF